MFLTMDHTPPPAARARRKDGSDEANFQSGLCADTCGAEAAKAQAAARQRIRTLEAGAKAKEGYVAAWRAELEVRKASLDACALELEAAGLRLGEAEARERELAAETAERRGEWAKAATLRVLGRRVLQTQEEKLAFT